MRNDKQTRVLIVLAVVVVILLVIVGVRVQRWLGASAFGLKGGEQFAIGGTARVLSSEMMVAEDAASVVIDETGAPDVAPEDRKIIRNAQMSLVADDVRATADAISAYAIERGGFVVNSSYNKEGIVPFASVSVRVPAADLIAAMAFVGGLGEVRDTDVSGQDVTAQFVDVEAQLRNYRAAETSLLSLFNRSSRVEDVLAVHRELTNIRNEIERLEGRLKYLRESVELSLLTVYVSADPSGLPVIDEADQWKPLATVKQAVRGLAAFGKWLGDAVIWVVVFVPVIALVWGIVWLALRTWRLLA